MAPLFYGARFVQLLHHTRISDIVVAENRIRKEFSSEKLSELADSIASKGLLHPPVLRADGKTLLAGERRLRAMSLLHMAQRPFTCNGLLVTPGETPFILASDLSELDLREAELEENTKRTDLSWQEHARAIEELNDIRRGQRNAKGETYTVADLARELISESAAGAQQTKLANTLRVAAALSDPEIAAAPDESTALKILQRKADAEHRALLAQQFNLSSSPHIIRCGNSFSLLEEVPVASVDILITDPPYGIGADDFGSQADARHAYVDDIAHAVKCYELLVDKATELCRRDAFLFIFLDIDMFDTVRFNFESADWKVFSTPLVWNKAGGMLPWPDSGPRNCAEFILYAKRGSRKFITAAPSSVIDIPKIAKPVYGAAKPPELYKHLLSWVARPGDTILDPFAGTGPVVSAASALNCRAIAFDIDPEKINYILAGEQNGRADTGL